MPNARYRKGTRAEKKSRRFLEAQGYYVVEARGSHGAVDLIGTSLAGIVIVQVKSGRKLTRPEFAAARDALRSVPIPDSHASREMHHWNDYEREPIVEIV